MTRARKWQIAAGAGLLVAAAVLCSLLCATRATHSVVCLKCGEVAEQEYWFGRAVSASPLGSRCCQLRRKYFGGDCAHEWTHTGSFTERDLFGFPLSYADGYPTHGDLFWMEPLRALDDAGRTSDVRLGLQVVACMGERGGLRELNRFFHDFRPESGAGRLEREGYADYCARTVRSWAEKLGIEEEGL